MSLTRQALIASTKTAHTSSLPYGAHLTTINFSTEIYDALYLLCNSSIDCASEFRQKSRQQEMRIQSNTAYDLDTYLKFRIILTWLSLLIILVGLLGNFFSFLILINKKMRISTNVFLASLCVSAFIALIGLLINSVIYEIFAYYGLLQALQILYYFYPYAYPIITTFQMASILLTVCVSVNQFVCIYYSKAKNRSKKGNQEDCRTALVIVLIMYVISIIYCVPYWLKFKYTKENGLLVTDIGQDPLFNRIVHFWMYLPIVYIIPFSILIITNTYLLCTIMIARRRRKRLGMGNCNVNSYSRAIDLTKFNNNNNNNNNNDKEKHNTLNGNDDKIEAESLIKKLPVPAPLTATATSAPVLIKQKISACSKAKAGGMNITIMLLAVVFFFFICQFPNLILHIITSMICTNENTKCSASGFYQYSLATSKLLLICNLSFNFIIYCLFSEKFREVLNETFNCFKRKISE